VIAAPSPTRTGAAVSQSHAVLVGSFISAFNLRDLDGMLAWLAGDVEFHPLKVHGIADGYRGHAGVKEWFTRIVAFDDEHRIVVGAIEPLSAGRVLAVGHLELGDARLTTPFCGIHRVRDGLIARSHHYMSDLETLYRLGIAA
jgi:hypothetical protein